MSQLNTCTCKIKTQRILVPFENVSEIQKWMGMPGHALERAQGACREFAVILLAFLFGGQGVPSGGLTEVDFLCSFLAFGSASIVH